MGYSNHSQDVPEHVAIIMDGNRRWAKNHGFPVAFGHASGAKRVRSIVEACYVRGIRFITIFAFSTENWKRPATEVSFLMGLLGLYLRKEIKDMNTKGVRLKVIGNTSQFSPQIQALIRDAQANTEHNDRITLTVAANYGGRWDILQAVNKMHMAMPSHVGEYDEEHLASHLAMHYAPEPDLFIRTGGEKRISNFMLWQLAYTELYFTDTLWPDFDESAFNLALASYQNRERRFGRTSEQVSDAASNN